MLIFLAKNSLISSLLRLRHIFGFATICLLIMTFPNLSQPQAILGLVSPFEIRHWSEPEISPQSIARGNTSATKGRVNCGDEWPITVSLV